MQAHKMNKSVASLRLWPESLKVLILECLGLVRKKTQTTSKEVEFLALGQRNQSQPLTLGTLGGESMLWTRLIEPGESR
jgi:hypothetical protein